MNLNVNTEDQMAPPSLFPHPPSLRHTLRPPSFTASTPPHVGVRLDSVPVAEQSDAC